MYFEDGFFEKLVQVRPRPVWIDVVLKTTPAAALALLV